MITACLCLFAVLLVTGLVGTILFATSESSGYVNRMVAYYNAGTIAELLVTVFTAIISGFTES